MRRLIPLLLVLGACTSATEEVEPVDSAPSAPTTSVTQPSTTTTQPTTTTTDEGCVERDGLRKNPRGFICPPRLWAEGFPEFGDPTHLPGRYETRFFEPALSFQRAERFISLGENPGEAVALDGGTFTPWTYAIGSDLVDDVRSVDLGAVELISDVLQSEVDILGGPAVQIDFVVAQDCETFTGECRIPTFDDLHITIESWTEGDRVRLLILDRPERTVAFEITAEAEEFDTYWTEVARPILDSIEFLDQ